MKKIFLIGMATAAILASCSNDETVEMVQPKAIGFESFVDKSTRGVAEDLTTTNIQDFGVYGFMTDATGVIFANEKVSKSESEEPEAEEKWGYTNTQYWTANKDYWFSAIAPHTGAQWTYDVNSKVEGGIITFDNKEGKQDLLYAYSDKITCTDPATQGKVSFTFSHLLSRVKFNFSNAMGNENTFLVVKEVTITDANSKATCDVSVATKSWTLAADNAKGNLVFDAVPNAETKIANNAAIATDHKYMIPQTQTYTLNFKVEMYQGKILANTYTHTGVTVPQVAMQPGYSYIFNAELTPDNIDPEGKLYPIEFDVTDVDNWEEFTSGGNVTIPEKKEP